MNVKPTLADQSAEPDCDTETGDRSKQGHAPIQTLGEIQSSFNEDKIDYESPDVDPDFIFDVDLPIEVPNTQTDSPVSSGVLPASERWKSKSVNVNKDGDLTKMIKTRARPIKAHEIDPFLSVDTLSPEKQKNISPGSGHTNVRRTPLKQHGSSLRADPPSQTAYRSTALTPSVTPRGLSVLGRHTPVSPYISPSSRGKKTNIHVKSPFKHAVNQRSTKDVHLSPSDDLKDQTALATYHISQCLSPDQPEKSGKPSGKLRAGKLKPLNPVSQTGPRISQCRGVVSQTRTYLPSPNKTLQRRLQLMNSIPNVNEYIYQRPRTVESIHRTSVASSVDDNESETEDFSENEPDEISGNIEDYEDKKQTSHTQIKTESEDEKTPRMFATEIRSGVEDTVNDISNKLNNVVNTGSQDRTDGNVNNNAVVHVDIRPRTAEIMYGDTALKSPSRPYTAGDIMILRNVSPKSVHFVDDPFKNFTRTPNSKAIKELNNVRISRQQKGPASPGGDNPLLIASKQETSKKKLKKKDSESPCKPEVKARKTEDDDSGDEKGRQPPLAMFYAQGTSSALFNIQNSRPARQMQSENKETKPGKSHSSKQNRINFRADKMSEKIGNALIINELNSNVFKKDTKALQLFWYD